MKLKSYHSATVEAAIRLAHIELGDEAVFLGSRRNDVGGDPNQAYEVTFAVIEGENGAAGKAATERRAAAAAEAARTAPVRTEPVRPGMVRAGTVSQKERGAGAARAGAGPRPAQAAAAGADAGGLVSWKKLLRQVSLRDAGQPNGRVPDPSGSDAREVGPPPDPRAEARTPNAEARATVRPNGPQDGRARSASMPHWREFVPGEMRRSGDPSEQVLLADASRVAEAGSSQAGSLQAGDAAPRHSPATRNGESHAAAQPAKKKPRTPPPAEPRTSEVYSLQKLGAELEELRRMFERQQSGRTPLVLPSRELLSDTRLAEFYHRLSDNSVEPSLASELVAALQPAADEGADARRLGALLADAVRARFKTNSDLGRPGAGATVAALVGPSGAGKSTAVAKLAFRCGVLRRRRVRLFSVDPLRMGAVESLQAYAELMNLPLKVVEDGDALGAALGAGEEDGESELLLIDTPGYGRREWERARRLAGVFRERGDVDVHLVVDLRTKSEDLCLAVENFRMFRPAKLLFTRLDETTSFGTMLNETVRSGLPVSFVSVGQRVPEDIVPAGEPELLRLLLKSRSSN